MTVSGSRKCVDAFESEVAARGGNDCCTIAARLRHEEHSAYSFEHSAYSFEHSAEVSRPRPRGIEVEAATGGIEAARGRDTICGRRYHQRPRQRTIGGLDADAARGRDNAIETTR